MRLFVIDGYNVVHAGSPYRQLAEKDLDTARARLVGDVSAFVGGDDRAIIVFDGASNPSSDGSPHELHHLTVIFSPFGRDADSVIEAIVTERRGTGLQMVVVTSDQMTQWVTIGVDVTRRSSAEFISDLAEETHDRSEHRTGDGDRSTIGDRLNPDTRDALARWARE